MRAHDTTHANNVVLTRHVSPPHPPQLSGADFMQASWDWVQDATKATSMWDSIEEWDVSRITTMDYAFSKYRDEAGALSSSVSNAKADTFNGDVSKWDTQLVTSLNAMFRGAAAFNVDVGKWSTSKVRKGRGLGAGGGGY